MKFSVAYAAAFLTLLAGFANAAVISHLLPRAPNLQSYLGAPRRFYRAVYKDEITAVGTRYVKDKSPADHKTNSGDFSPAPTGGLYVFNNPDEAMTWGDCYTRGTQFESKGYYLAVFEYTPNPSLKTHTFVNGDAAWLKFVNDNYKSGTKASGFDIVEGPISATGERRAQVLYEREGASIWQGAFITPAALKTLKIAELIPVRVDKKRPNNLRRCCTNCIIM
ncbi:hypothetical protein HGRIS_013566 [Hohenbuehelia grisea]|uniref:Uncharacterized protein n=1 Tax=Hohenbuehelia grisea TaxID=104357 RepID=A0ABR3IW09_9AGAR